MHTRIKTSLLFCTFTLLVCFNLFFLLNTTAQVNITPVAAPDDSNYSYERIEVSGVDHLELTASNDFEDYAGNTPGADGEKMVGFTIIDGVFTTYDFPGSQNTYFYAFGNDGRAAGHYEDSDGLHHGVILENGELRQFDIPDSVETFIYGISDTTGDLTGDFIDAAGVRRGFTGDEIVEFPGASETFAQYVSAGRLVGSYVDSEGIYHGYVRDANGKYTSIDFPNPDSLNYAFFHGINSAGMYVARSNRVNIGTRTFVGTFRGRHVLQFPGSVTTEGWNINEDGSVVGYYDTADGRRQGFVARLVEDTTEPVGAPADVGYTFESIDVPGVDFLELTASSDFEDYAGNTRNGDGGKTVGFTLIDGVFKTYDFPGSRNTYFYALGNDGRAAGHYEDNEGLFHGVVLLNGELTQYDFPGSVQTFLYGISDSTGALTGNFIDADGIRRGFTGETIIQYPGAVETFADFVAAGRLVGSYIDADGIYHAYLRTAAGEFTSIDLENPAEVEYFFMPGVNDAGAVVVRYKETGDVPRTYVGSPLNLRELQVPGAVSTEGWNINEDGSVVGHYDSPDGRRHGFIARLVAKAESDHFGNVYRVTLAKGLNMISVPLAPPNAMTARSLAGIAGATTVITLDVPSQRFVAWTPSAPDDGFPIEGGNGYIVNVPGPREFAFVGAPWTDEMKAASPPAISAKVSQDAWAFVVSGRLKGKSAFDGYQVIVRNLRTDSATTASVQGDYFAAATADLARRSVVHVGDRIEVRAIGPDGNVESQSLRFEVTSEHLANAVLSVRIEGIGQPPRTRLLQNYPNPFNPETWIPYQLSEDGAVSIAIYDTTGKSVRVLPLGFQSAGFYNNRERAAYWDGRNAFGERVASGAYFYRLTTPSFHQTRRLVIIK